MFEFVKTFCQRFSLTWFVTSPWQRRRKTSTPPTVTRRALPNILKRGSDNLAVAFLTLADWCPRRSGRAGGLAFSQSLEVDGQRLFLWVWRTPVLLFGDHVAHDPPKTHKDESQDVGQHPLWVELGVGGPGHKDTLSHCHPRLWSQIKIYNPNINSQYFQWS